MLDTSKQSSVWNFVLFTPTLVALMVATLSAKTLVFPTFLISWGLLNAVCSLWCAYDHLKVTENLALRSAKTIGIGLLFWIMNALLSFFGGCTCAFVVGGR